MIRSKAMETATAMGRTIVRGNPLLTSVIVFAAVAVLFVVVLVEAAAE